MSTSQPDPFQAATFVVALLALILSVLSLGWQAATFFLEGGRVKAKFSPGVTGPGALVTLEPKQFKEQATLAALANQGYSQPVVCIEVRNVGRLPVTVNSWHVTTDPGGIEMQPAASSIGPALPHRLDAGASATWAVDYRPVLAMVKTTATVKKIPEGELHLRGKVKLGDGRVVKAKGRL